MTDVAHQLRIGMAGLGTMGSPMAARFIAGGVDVLLWNRDPAKLEVLRAGGTRIATSPAHLVGDCDVILMMLANDHATDEVLGLHATKGNVDLSCKLIVNMGTGSPERSVEREASVAAAGGTYIEAPVSGSRVPAEMGQLVAMVAGGRRDQRAVVEDLIAPLCRASFDAGSVPGALNLKLAVNLFLIATVAGLAEAFHFGGQLGVDRRLLRDVLAASPMASAVSIGKANKMVDQDFAVQAAISDVHMNCRLVADAADRAGASTPLLANSLTLFAERDRSGDGALDMASVVRSFKVRATSEAALCVGRQFDACNRRDLDAFVSCWSEDAVIWSVDGTMLAEGRHAIANRHRRRFEDPQLSALLTHRAVAGSVVVDQERVIRTAADGTVEEVEIIAIYDVFDGLIQSARLCEGLRHPAGVAGVGE